MSEETIEAQAQHAKEDSSAKKERKRMKLLKKIVLIVAIFLVVLLAVGGVSLAVVLNTGKSELLESNESAIAYRHKKFNGQKYVYNDDVVSVVLIGEDRYGNALPGTNGQSDAVMVGAYNIATGKITLINVPRNIWFETTITFSNGERRTQEIFISSLYAIADDAEGGAKSVCNGVSDLFGNIPMKNYCVLSMLCVGPLVDAMGGVTITATDDVPIANVVKGETYTLTSWAALRYVQYRNPDIMSSPADRMVRQHDFAKAFLNQTVAAVKKDPAVLGRLYDVVTNPEYITTNLDLPEIAFFAFGAITHGVSDVNLVTIPYDDQYNEDLIASEYIPDEEGLKQLLIDTYYLPVDEAE